MWRHVQENPIKAFLCFAQAQEHAALMERLFPKPRGQTGPHQAMTHLILQD